jgi:hypothetical protein
MRAVRSNSLFSTLRLVGVKARNTSYQRTRHGWHVVVDLNMRLSPAETIALQAVCGSDRKREALDLMREIALARGKYPRFWIRRFNILYKGKLP